MFIEKLLNDRRSVRSLVVALILGAAGAAPGRGDPAATEPVPVASVDLARYSGTWYELARIPNRFQRDCACDVTARYAVRPDGSIDVLNKCRKRDGSYNKVRGEARVVDANTNARLEVSFFSILGLRPVWGDYWILGLGDRYEYAVVGSPDRKYGWILVRRRDLGAETLTRIWDTVRAQGFDPAEFVPSFPCGANSPGGS